ncbi:MAG TPA: hypothetical protein VK462_00265 [Nitrososphaeraceae archaeon]|nr:hypothetical protein [Nitrososphaeraceae archaeon]
MSKPKSKEVRMKNTRSDKKNARKKNQRLTRSSNGGIKLRTIIDWFSTRFTLASHVQSKDQSFYTGSA